MIRKIKKEVGCSFKENIQYMDQTLPVEKRQTQPKTFMNFVK